MPVEMAGAGVVEAAWHSPTDVNLGSGDVLTKITVNDIVYGSAVTPSDVTVSITQNGTKVGEGTLVALNAYGALSDYDDLKYAVKQLDKSVGTHTASLTLKGDGTKLKGQKTVSFTYKISKPTSTTMNIYADYTGTDLAPSPISVGKSVRLNAFLGSSNTDPYEGDDAVITYTLGQGSEEYLSVSDEGRVTGLKRTTSFIPFVKVTCTAPSILDEPKTQNIYFSVDAGNSAVYVENTKMNISVGGKKSIDAKDYAGTLTYRALTVGTYTNAADVVNAPSNEESDLVSVDAAGVVTGLKSSTGKAYVYVIDTVKSGEYNDGVAMVTVTVSQNDGSLKLASTEVSVSVKGTESVAWTSDSNGAVSAVSVDGTVATATVSGSNVVVSGVGKGSTFVKVKQAPSTKSLTDPTVDGKYPETEVVLAVTVTGTSGAFDISTDPVTVEMDGWETINFSGAIDSSLVTAVVKDGGKGDAKVTAVPGEKTGTGYVKIEALKQGELTVVVTDPGNTQVAETVKEIAVTVVGTTSSFTINPEKVESLTVNEKTTALYIGQAGTVTATPVSGTSGSVAALVNNGKIEITGLTAGDAAVAVKDSGSDTVAASEKTIAVKVVQRDSEFKLTSDKADIKANGTANIGYTGNKGTVTTSIKSGNGVVSISGNKVTGLKEGTAVITVTDPGNAEYKGASYDFTVNVTKNASSFALNATSASVKYGAKYTIGWKNAAGSVTVTSGNSAVATADSKGVVTIKKPGTASFTVKDSGSDTVAASTKTFKLTVTQATQNVTIGFKSGSTKVGGTAVYTISGIKTSAPAVTSGNKKFATISSKSKTQIKVKCVAAGTAKITVKVPGSTNYKAVTKTFNVKVTAASQTLKVSPTSVTLASRGKSKKLTVTGNKTKVTYKSSNTNVAKVASNGKITAIKKGSCYVTVTAAKSSNYTAATKKIKVTVGK
jgi:hypothetical protein